MNRIRSIRFYTRTSEAAHVCSCPSLAMIVPQVDLYYGASSVKPRRMSGAESAMLCCGVNP